MAAPAATENPLGLRIVVGLVGVLIASFTAGLNEYITQHALMDIKGALSIGHDEGTWLTVLYSAAGVCGMAFAPWCSYTFTIRRFTLFAIAAFAFLAFLGPFALDLRCLYLLRTLQGLMGGCLPPMLMTVALRFLPPNVKLYGLAAYALTATFTPNIAIPLSALWVEHLGWTWAFWQAIPLCAICFAAVAYGLPQDPMHLERFEKFDTIGLLTGMPGLCAIVVGLLQGDRLDILKRRNFTFGLIALTCILIMMTVIIGMPAKYLSAVHEYRPRQVAPLTLLVALPQLPALFLVGALCNLRRVDCRWVMAAGALCCATSCIGFSFLSSDWTRENFYLLMLLQIVGQPMAIIPILMLATSAVVPAEGVFASSWFNTTRAIASVFGSALTSYLTTERNRFHSDVLVGQLGDSAQVTELYLQELHERLPGVASSELPGALGHLLQEQVVTMTVMDVFLAASTLAVVVLVTLPLIPTRIYPPRSPA